MRKMSIAIVLMMLLLCCVGVAIVLYNFGFWSFPLPERSFAARDLLLGAEGLGDGWSLIEDHGATGDLKYNIVIEKWHREFVHSTEGQVTLRIEHFVYRCDNKAHARSYVSEYRRYLGEHAPPQELVMLFQPHYADEWLLFGEGGYAARYDEYFVFFAPRDSSISVSSALEEGIISYKQIAAWLRLLDEHTGRLLGKTSR